MPGQFPQLPSTRPSEINRLPDPQLLISEIGPRDGLQSVKACMPTADKLRWIDALYAAGVREIEVASFVPARLLPQMRDAAEVVRHAITLPGLSVMALVSNRRDAEAALANVRKTREEMVEEVRIISALRQDLAPHVGLEVGISTAFGCTLQGAVAEDDVIWRAAQCVAAGADEAGLSDTVGYANPAQVRRLFRRTCAPRSAGTRAPPTCTTHAAWAWPTAWRRMTKAFAPLTPRWAGWAAARICRAHRATS
ncbi:isopropylmalate/homocitrate/citramalate synthase [Polaromonas sp. CG_9.11]|nr:isopropylmalate/homocitrate/citramalate synthase [Polaromonas sp. CG_9.11]